MLRANQHVLRRQTAHENGEPMSVGAIMAKTVPSYASSTSPVENFRAQALLDVSNMPRRHRLAMHSIRDLESNAAWRASRDRVVDSMGSGYLLSLIGKRGTGKSQIASFAMAASCKVGRPALYVKAMDFFNWCKLSMRDDGPSIMDVVTEFVTPALLVIDEVQVRGETAFEDSQLINLIDKRYDAMVDTIIIANLLPDELAESLGPSICSRMNETGGVIECKWESFRESVE